MSARRAQQPAYATAGAPYDGGAGAGGAVMEAPAAPPSDLERGFDHIRSMDPTFDPATVAATARGLFGDVQRALIGRDMSPVAARLTSRMYTELSSQCDRLRGSRRTNRMESIDVRQAEATEAWQESGADYVTIYLAGSLVDYTVDDASGELVEGSRTPQAFEEYWTFTRPVGPNAWRLSAIQTA
jgi:predicted lipid-binding transport protein (Tim44 family)